MLATHQGRESGSKTLLCDGRGRARRAPSWAIGAAASGIALASTAAGRPALAREWTPAGDAGIFLAAHFGAGRALQWGFGLEARGVFIQEDGACDETPMLVFSGAVARAELIGGWKQVRLTLGPAVGMTNGIFGFGADVTGGVGVPLGSTEGAALVGSLGLDATALVIPNARAAYVLGTQPDLVLGVGARLPPLVIHKACVVGRPVRRGVWRAPVAGGHVRTAGVGHSRGRHAGEPVDHTAERAGRVWLRRASMEWASVPAFCELGEQLRACEAPASLQARARQAAADELRHAVDSARVSVGLSGALGLDLDPPITTNRELAQGREALTRLVVESWHDGCLGEGAAAALANLEADAAGIATITRTQRTIAADEGRHAELAWEVIEWVLGRDPACARPLLEEAAAGALSSRPDGGAGEISGAGLRRFGITDGACIGDTATRVGAESRARLLALLAR